MHADRPSRWRASPARLARLLVGLWLFGSGEALMVESGLGNAPWTVLAEGISVVSPLSIGAATILTGALVLCAWVPLRVRPGLGTVLNVVVIGVALDVMVAVLPAPAGLSARAAFLVAGVALVGLGSGFYLTARLGTGPRDGLMTGIGDRTGWPLPAVRAGIEVSVLLAGFALGGTVGVGTVVFAVMIGPAVGVGLRLLGDRRPQPVGAPRA